ncbi:pyruvate formate-lyase/glycerol dehydratase family glycyl radical enzyme [Breznakia sp. PF5-3]|uniref:glycyl radical protein n=1 Tax=unclassified Breznakia TaxID=2623764 RepID=UPI00240773B5|nr:MULTISPECIES: formate C-acetyltransferase/glycerol dehydratase family glycyl radical enzyme [unclassified Breznakia]MDF9825282.1 pyruvate formate-lyase/glycerol dehydratase family glycyl radical enzyme [Breznakia sp. PM6-1]MDF9836172.1 pyruvate formate-lyase/glycerol dehydratase family glycyl radical enzyme [Breznakia sp. PF5-3]MDF9837382.1 pyruvate formate-lyase/glycerol dehydratase family glycyl radical enzyme [Breznakia sp. PFB2-8]MDF9859317.1 pyruvate formate-lyase/glycerol dehydratase f
MELKQSSRIAILKEKMLSQKRYVSIEQAKIITDVYKRNENKPMILKRALALKEALEYIEIGIEPEEQIVGNRTKGVRSGVVFPEGGCSWVDRELETLPKRPQDKFHVHPEDIQTFREVILPYWQGKSLEDVIAYRGGEQITAISKVAKINQTDHAQGHICPNCETWLEKGPAILKAEALAKIDSAPAEQKDFYESIVIVMDGAIMFMQRYRDLLKETASRAENKGYREDLLNLSGICDRLSKYPAQSFHEAVQSVWFLFVILQMESNASSFSPGRMDKFLYPYYRNDIDHHIIDDQQALELIESIWLKFNQIVYLRNKSGAKYFAGFPIGFNIAIGGLDEKGEAYENELSYLFLKAQEHLGLPQPNLSLRLNHKTSDKLLKASIHVVAKGSGMPQFFNDECIVPGMIDLGIEKKDAMDYAIVGCVELTTQGNNLGWSDSAMFNFNKALELTLNHGTCLITNQKLAPDFGGLEIYDTYEALEIAFEKTIDFYMEQMIACCEIVEKAHIDILPSPFLSSVIDNCMEKGVDVTAGGAKYNLNGIQMIQVANLADSLAALKKLVYEEKRIQRKALLNALQTNFENNEIMRQILLNKVDKYGNDVEWVDTLGITWAKKFRNKLRSFKNYRGGVYHTGMYTVSAHVPMGENVGASPDGRFSQTPLADGGMSAVYGRDTKGPTAVFKSVSRIDNDLTTNGGLLNMKFLPTFFKHDTGIDKFSSFLRSFVDLKIPHVQFNVVCKEDLLAAQEHPEQYRSLTIRVAGYTAYFTELAGELQNEIIARTSYEDI